MGILGSLIALTLLLVPSVHAGIAGDIGEAVFNATKEGFKNMVLEETGMIDSQGTANNYRGSQDTLIGVFYWGIVSNPDHMSGGPIKTFWNAIFYLAIAAFAVYLAAVGIMFMIPKFSVSRVQASGAERAEAWERLENAFYGIVLVFMSYYLYAFLVYAEAELVTALDLDMSSFILDLLGHGHIIPMILVILLFFVMSLLLIFRYFIVWIGPIPFTIGLAMRFMDRGEEPGALGRIGAKLIGYTVGMIFSQFVVAFYLYMTILFYEANKQRGWLFQEITLIGILAGAVLVFFKVIGFMSSDAMRRMSTVIITKTPVRRATRVFRRIERRLER
jgi:hypothetical protein